MMCKLVDFEVYLRKIELGGHNLMTGWRSLKNASKAREKGHLAECLSEYIIILASQLQNCKGPQKTSFLALIQRYS